MRKAAHTRCGMWKATSPLRHCQLRLTQRSEPPKVSLEGCAKARRSLCGVAIIIGMTYLTKLKFEHVHERKLKALSLSQRPAKGA